MPTDTYRANINSNGNVLAMYYNNFDDGGWATNSGVQAAALIDQWANNNFANTGAKPQWLILNEISSGTWPSSSTYRAYVDQAVQELATTYGYSVIIYSPFPNPANNPSDWQAVATYAYIAVENYLSGLDIENQGYSVSWCQNQYQSSITSYASVGVPKSRLMLGEHFGQTTSDDWGRENVSSNAWITAINARSQAAANLAFPGFLSFAWYSDLMQVSEAEEVTDESAYTSNSLPTTNPLTAPYIIIQPQPQTIPPGGTVAFSVVMAGNAPLTYQWQRNGANLPGATTNPLMISNVSGPNSGVYSVVISNSAGGVKSASVALQIVASPLAADLFAPAISTYTVGTNLVGQTNAAGLTWTAAGPNGSNIVIEAGSLSVPGLNGSTGNSISLGVSTGPNARFNLPNSILSGPVYYSFAFRVDDLGALNTSGGFFAAFNNSTGTQSNVPMAVAACVQTRLSGTGFNVGLKGAQGGSVFDTAVYSVGQTVFVVGEYTINTTSSTDDTASLWINPSSATFGSANAPTPTLTTISGGDIANDSIASFIFFRRGSGNTGLEPAALTADELRIGTNWASVTPPAAITVIPTLNAALSDANLVLSWTTSAAGFNLYSAPLAFSSSSDWTAVSGTPSIVGTNYVVTNALTGGRRFYRLSDP